MDAGAGLGVVLLFPLHNPRGAVIAFAVGALELFALQYMTRDMMAASRFHARTDKPADR